MRFVRPLSCVRGSYKRATRNLDPRQSGLILLVLLYLSPAPLWAQTAFRDLTGPSVQGNPDVTNGLKYLLEEDDLGTVQLIQNPTGSTEIQVSYTPTQNSNAGLPQTTTVSTTKTIPAWISTSLTNSIAVGRVFEIASDDIGVLAPQDGPSWLWYMQDPKTNFSGSMTPNARFKPYGGVFTQIVMGNFLRNFLATPLVFYLSDGENQTEWAMRVLTPTDRKTEQLPMTQGPEYYSFNQPGVPVPITGSIVAGDFNGDGKDEIALLMTDNQTINFYSVSPTTLTITKTATLTLPQAFTNGGGTLVAGRFRDTSNSELVAIGSGQQNSNTVIYSIQITPNSSHTAFTPSIAQTLVLNGHVASSFSGTAAPILVPMETTELQLVFAEKLSDNTFFDIGSFDQNFNFTLQSFSNLGADLVEPPNHPRLFNFQVGNFDNQNGNGTHNPASQLETYTQDAVLGNTAINIWDIIPPQQCNTPPCDWLKGLSENFLLNSNSIIASATMAGDLQGRSLRLGPPEIVTIPQQLQPDIVLGIPPMHIDWVTPTVAFQNTILHPGCDQTTQPCVLNLTVLPNTPRPEVGFRTGFNFLSDSFSNGSRKSTTSWGISVKNSASLKISWDDIVDSESVKIKSSTQYAHDHTVSKTYNHYSGTTQGVSATTGFADYVFYTEKDLNIYYYPVIAQTACPNNDPNCTEKQPVYVEFSVPDQVTHYDVDGTTLEWYQPAHEAGNALSYPWNLSQLQQGFVNNAVPLTENPAPVQGTDSSHTIYTTTWSGGTGDTNTSGSTNAFSDDISVSFSSKGGLTDVLSGKFTDKLNVGGSGSFSTLNENTASLSASSGVAVNKPAFDSEVAACCLYNFGSYIFGQQNTTNPVYQAIKVLDPDKHEPVTLQSSGPLFVGFEDDLVPNGSNGVSDFFVQAYTLPDISVGHPARWAWNQFQQVANFNPPNASDDPLSAPFYWMRGFFITQADEPTTAPNLAEASAGEQLSLSARIWNFSLVDTNGPSLAHPAASIHVRFYGQFLCHSGVNTENSCKGPNDTTCPRFSLCGNSFLIGETTLASIPAFNSVTNQGTVPNWALTSPVNFDTTAYPNTYLVFWVAVWMEDANGDLVPEMPGHGMTANPDSLAFQQITQVPFEFYSNNVGMYGVNAPFFVCPAGACSHPNGFGRTQMGSLASVKVSAKEQLRLDERVKVTTELRAENGDINDVNLLYYDGDPKKGGKLFDVQHIAHMKRDATYGHRSFYRPQSCGIHQLFARAWIDNAPDVIGEFTTYVTVVPAALTFDVMTSTRGTEMSANLRDSLVLKLKAAIQEFSNKQEAAALHDIDLYIKELTDAEGNGIKADFARRLIAQADAIIGCAPARNNIGLHQTSGASAPSEVQSRVSKPNTWD